MARPSTTAKERRPQFFKVFISDISSKRLGIPPDFCRHIEPNMNRRICLRRPRGSSWSADLVREEGGGVFFQNGWEEFVSDLDLKTGDFLVFKYGGGPRFTVLVFDPTGCEKEASQTAPFPEVVILGESHRTRRRPGKEVVTFVAKEEPQSDEDASDACTRDSRRREKPERSADEKGRSATRRPSCERPTSPGSSSMDDDELHQCGVRIKTRLGSVISHRRRITEEEKARTLESALCFRSKHPFGLSVMRDSNVYHGYYMGLPSSLTEHLPRADRTMQLRSPSMEAAWEVAYVHCEGRGGFSAGWGTFARALDLESDDVLVFELFRPLEVRVHIYRVIEKLPWLS